MPAALKELPKAPASYFGGKPKSYGGERYARRAEGYISLKECRTDKPPRHAAHDFLVELKDWSIVHLKAPNYFKVSQDEVIFRGLAHKWKRETGHFSVLARRYQHPSYRAIL